ncbi:DUF397 domain-containing protein [Streptomyces xiamenensis]
MAGTDHPPPSLKGVEIALVAGRQGVAVRDTKDRTIPAALIPTAAWATFLTVLKGNRE